MQEVSSTSNVASKKGLLTTAFSPGLEEGSLGCNPHIPKNPPAAPLPSWTPDFDDSVSGTGVHLAQEVL